MFDPIENSELVIGRAVPVSFGRKLKNSLDWLYAQVSRLGGGDEVLANPSFAVDADEDGQPDNWALVPYTGGAVAYDTAAPPYGARNVKMTHPGGGGTNGGGYVESDYVMVSQYVSPLISFLHKSTAAALKNVVQIKYYDKDKVFISSEDVYSSTSNPTSWTPFARFGVPPANACYATLVFIGGHYDVPSVSGVAHFAAITWEPFPNVIPITFTISEATGGSSYGDGGSASVRLPKGCSRLLIPITLGYYSYGFYYFGDGTVDLAISALSGTQTLYLQSKADGSHLWARARVSTTYSTEIQIADTASTPAVKKGHTWALCVRDAA
jgi:hypothetical protein